MPFAEIGIDLALSNGAKLAGEQAVKRTRHKLKRISNQIFNGKVPEEIAERLEKTSEAYIRAFNLHHEIIRGLGRQSSEGRQADYYLGVIDTYLELFHSYAEAGVEPDKADEVCIGFNINRILHFAGLMEDLYSQVMDEERGL